MSSNTPKGRGAPKDVRKKEKAISVDIDPFSKLLDLEPEKEDAKKKTSPNGITRKK